MTVPNAIRTANHTGDGATASFPYGFRIFADSDLVVVTTDDATGVDTTHVLGVDYTVLGAGDPAGGSVEFTTPPTAGHHVKVERVLDLVQTLVNLTVAGSFPPDVIEKGFDYQVMLAQQLKETAIESVDADGLPAVYTLADRPAASLAWAGRRIRVQDSGAPEFFQYCIKNADGSYQWNTLSTGDP